MGWLNARPMRLTIKALQVQPEDAVLELGFGSGHGIAALARLATRGQVIGVDHSRAMLAQAARRNRTAMAQGRVRLRLCPFDQTLLPDASVNKVLAVNVAYFFHEDGREIREAWRVLKPGGRMALYVTHRNSMRHWKFASGGSHHLHDEASLEALLLRGGFSGKHVDIQRVRIARGIDGLLAVVGKPAEDT